LRLDLLRTDSGDFALAAPSQKVGEFVQPALYARGRVTVWEESALRDRLNARSVQIDSANREPAQ
jgi:hypothetical protein